MHHGHRMPKGIHLVGWIVGGIVTAVVVGFLFGYFVMLLWNWLMPSLFGLKAITYWQAFGLVLLARLLFGSPGHHGHHGHHGHSGHHGYGHPHMRRRCHDEDYHMDDWHDWEHYDDWWKAEGKQAFRTFVASRKSGSKEDSAREAEE